jgi:hypothetical protein
MIKGVPDGGRIDRCYAPSVTSLGLNPRAAHHELVRS